MPPKFIKSIAANWVENKNTTLAAAIAFYTLFSFSPILIISANVISLFVGKDIAQKELIDLIASNISPQAASITKAIFNSSEASNIFASILSFFILIYASGIAFAELRHAFNHIFGTEEHKTRKEKFLDFVRGKLKAIFLVPCTGFLFLLTLFSDLAVKNLDEVLVKYLNIKFSTLVLANDLLSFLLITLIFIGLFRFLPTKNLCFISLISGSLVSSILFLVGKNLLALYLASSIFTSFYGTAGSLVVVLLWVYYSVQMLLLGAEVAKQIENTINKPKKKNKKSKSN